MTTTIDDYRATTVNNNDNYSNSKSRPIGLMFRRKWKYLTMSLCKG